MSLPSKPTLQALLLSLAAVGTAAAGTTPAPQPAPTPPAPTLSYDYLEAGYSHLWLDDTPLNLFDNHDGYHLGLNKSITPNLFVLADFTQVFSSESRSLNAFGETFDASGDLNSLDAVLGLGFHTPVTSSVDWVLQLGATYAHLDLDVSARDHRGHSWSIDEAATIDGFGLQAATGFRLALTQWLELDLFYQYAWSDVDAEVLGTTLSSADADLHAGKAALIFRNLGVPNLDLVVSGLLAESVQSLNAGLRYNF